MDSNIDIDSIRKATISRRGGVRTRGGRLPPIRIHNVPGLIVGSSNKKVFIPKIPQRRVQAKEEEAKTVPQPSTSSQPVKRITEPRGRGRGKVFIQTEGSFLGQGPGIKIKKEFRGPLYDKASYISDTPRSKAISLRGIDSSVIEELLKPYDDEEYYDSPLNPVKYPLFKKKIYHKELKINIKEEVIDPKDCSEKMKVNIKQEINKTEMKPFIKQEPIDEYEHDMVAGKDSFQKDFDSKKDLKDIKLFQEEIQLFLLQLPTCLPFIKPSINKDQSEKKKSEASIEKEPDLATIRDLGEGCIGKLQIMKSGQMRVVFGSCTFILEEEIDSKSSWKVASISVEDECKASISMLGKIKCLMRLQPLLSS